MLVPSINDKNRKKILEKKAKDKAQGKPDNKQPGKRGAFG